MFAGTPYRLDEWVTLCVGEQSNPSVCALWWLPADITIRTRRTSDADLHTSIQLRQLFCAWQVTAFYAIARSTVKLRPAYLTALPLRVREHHNNP